MNELRCNERKRKLLERFPSKARNYCHLLCILQIFVLKIKSYSIQFWPFSLKKWNMSHYWKYRGPFYPLPCPLLPDKGVRWWAAGTGMKHCSVPGVETEHPPFLGRLEAPVAWQEGNPHFAPRSFPLMSKMPGKEHSTFPLVALFWLPRKCLFLSWSCTLSLSQWGMEGGKGLFTFLGSHCPGDGGGGERV